MVLCEMEFTARCRERSTGGNSHGEGERWDGYRKNPPEISIPADVRGTPDGEIGESTGPSAKAADNSRGGKFRGPITVTDEGADF